MAWRANKLCGATLLLGEPQDNDAVPDHLDFTPMDSSILCSVWPIAAPGYTQDFPHVSVTSTLGTTEGWIKFSAHTPVGLHPMVSFITRCNHDMCPKHWGIAIKSPHCCQECSMHYSNT